MSGTIGDSNGVGGRVGRAQLCANLESMNSKMSRPFLFGALAVLGAWALVTVISASNWYLDGAVYPGFGWFKTVVQFGSIWILWIFVLPVIVWIARRFPIDEGRWPKAVAVHLVASLIWAALYFPLMLIILRAWVGMPLFDNFIDGLKTFNYRAIHETFVYWVIAVTAYAFWHFKDRNDEQKRAAELALRNAQISEELIRSELRTLRDQLHPHFLFNTLNSIAGLIRTDDRDSALQVLARLSDLLRYTLETEQKPLVPVECEIEFIRRYLEIQEVRFRDRLQVSVEVEEACNDLLLPSMILQPLVENAVHHGVDNDRVSNQVALRVSESADRLSIQITNTTGENGTDRAGFGIGLQNVRQRLERLYDHSFSLEMTQGDDHTMVVTLAIPRTENSE